MSIDTYKVTPRTKKYQPSAEGLPLLAPLARPFHPGLSQILALSALSDEDQSFDAGPLARRLSLRLTDLEAWAKTRLESTVR